jgi:pimeloyl-ACP methyl ester carboxylesterase
MEPPWRFLAANALRPLLGPAATWAIAAPGLYAARTRREAPGRMEEDLRLREADATPGATVLAQLAAAALHDVRPRLGELAGLPVTVVHGQEDGIIPAKDGVALAAGIPGARLVMLPDCGHMLTTDAEHATADAVLDHLGAAAAA